MSKARDPLVLHGAAADRLMPMHVVVSATGHIISHGPTLSKLGACACFAGSRFLERFEFLSPVSDVQSVSVLRSLAGKTLRLRLRTGPTTTFKAYVIPIEGSDRLLVNLSFGISIVEAVRHFKLDSADFAPNDLATELLYLLEARNAIMRESQRLTLRLHGARVAAEEQAHTDALTGLANRRALDDALAGFLERGIDFGLMQLDLDLFKKVNDTFGHAAGDRVLKMAASVLTSETRGQDVVARVGGDEFVLLFVGKVKAARLVEIGERLIGMLELPVVFEDSICRISASIGITMTGFYARPDAASLMADADAALYHSKRSGRGRATMFSPGMETMDKAAG